MYVGSVVAWLHLGVAFAGENSRQLFILSQYIEISRRARDHGRGCTDLRMIIFGSNDDTVFVGTLIPSCPPLAVAVDSGVRACTEGVRAS